VKDRGSLIVFGGCGVLNRISQNYARMRNRTAQKGNAPPLRTARFFRPRNAKSFTPAK
jgi:hypothetical protein